MRLAYGVGDKFTWDDTRLTAAALGIFAFGILFYSLIPFFARTFFALHDTKTPTLVNIAFVILNIFLAVFLLNTLEEPSLLSDVLASVLKLSGIPDIRIVALPIALVVSGAFQALCFFLLLRTSVGEVLRKDFYVSLLKSGIAALALAFATYGILQVYGGVFPLTTYKEVLGQFLLASLGGMVMYGIVASALRSQEMMYFWKIVRSKLYGR